MKIIIAFISITLSSILSSSLPSISFPMLYDYENEQMFFIVQFGSNVYSRFYPVSLSSKYNTIFTFGRDYASSTMIIKSEEEISIPSSSISGKLATDDLHSGEFTFKDFEFILSTVETPVTWRKFLGLLSLSRSPHSFHNQLFSKGIITNRVIEFDTNAMLRIGEYNRNITYGQCHTISNADYWSCAIKGLIIGEMSHHHQYIDVNAYKHYLPLEEIVTLHSMEVDITAPYGYMGWFKRYYFGLDEKGEMKDNCNEVEDEDSQGHVIYKLACYDKLSTSYDSVTLILGKDLMIVLPRNEIYNVVKLQNKTVRLFRIQFKEGLRGWNIGWRLLKNNNAVLNEDENTIGFALSNTVFIAKLKAPLAGKIIIKIMLYVLLLLLISGSILSVYIHMFPLGKDFSMLLD